MQTCISSRFLLFIQYFMENICSSQSKQWVNWLIKVYVMTDLYPSGKLFHLGKAEPVRDERKKNSMLVKVSYKVVG